MNTLLLGPHPEKTGIRYEMWQNVVSSYVFEHLKLQKKINCVSLYKIAGNNSRYSIGLLTGFGEIVQIKDSLDVRKKEQSLKFIHPRVAPGTFYFNILCLCIDTLFLVHWVQGSGNGNYTLVVSLFNRILMLKEDPICLK